MRTGPCERTIGDFGLGDFLSAYRASSGIGPVVRTGPVVVCIMYPWWPCNIIVGEIGMAFCFHAT